ncbi:hypothetical protein LLG46_05350 [bacterium]|nr:hypothetical protein [bacterium]
MRSRRAFFKIGFLAAFVCLAVLLWWGIFSHDWNLMRLRHRFLRIEHPAGTKLVMKKSDLGLLIAASNHMDYFVGEMRSYSGSQARIRRFYSNKTIWNPIAGRRYDIQVLFPDELDKLRARDPVVLEFEIPRPALEMAKNWSNKNRNHFYIVYVFDPGYACRFDLRGC